MHWKLRASFNGTFGKVDSYYKDNLLITEFSSLFQMLPQGIEEHFIKEKTNITNNLSKFLNFVKNSDFNEYADEVIMVFPDRLNKFYKTGIIDELIAKWLSEVNEIEELLGYYPIMLDMPILLQMQEFSLVSMFASLLFSMILALFVVISIILVHSLIMINVQQQYFDIGIKRMVGENESGIALNVILQTFAFSLPGIVIAFIFWFPALFAIYKYAFEDLLGLKLDPYPTFDAVISSIFLGLLIPIISAFLPIHEAIKRNINDALDYDRSKTKAEIVKIVDPASQNIGIYLIFGIISTIYAVAVYILLPQSLLELNFGMILKIFFLILIGMLLGLILVTTNIQYIIEYVITNLFFWWEVQSVKKLILKNLVAHRLRNSSTSLIYSLSLSFLILWVVSYNLQLQNIKSIKSKFHNGIELRDHYGLNIHRIEEVLEKRQDQVEAFGYQTYQISNTWWGIGSQVTVSDQARYFITLPFIKYKNIVKIILI